MESYPRRAGALLTVVAVKGAHVVVADADGVRHRARCVPDRASEEREPLKPGDVCLVDHVDPGEGRTMVERVNTLGQRDGARYALVDDRLASTSEPAQAAVLENMEATLRDGVPAIEQARVAVVPLVRTGSPQEDLVRAAAAVGADGLVIGVHSQRAVFDSGGPAQAICQRAPAVVVLASPGP